jgi:alpha,alpha-trehalase
MYDTALHEILNILDNIDRFGFMPNGARTYYVTRTQPPVAAIIVRCVYEALAAAADD